MTWADVFVEIFLWFRLGASGKAYIRDHCVYCKYHQTCSDINQQAEVIRRDRLPPKDQSQGAETLRLIFTSDTHERHEALGTLPKGDIFFHAGDILMSSRFQSDALLLRKIQAFNDWLGTVPCDVRVCIGGNHDRILEDENLAKRIFTNATFLHNKSIMTHGLKIFGTSYSRGKSGNRAFQSLDTIREAQVAVPEDPIDILVSHGPRSDLPKTVFNPRLLHFFGHIHGMRGIRAVKMEDMTHNEPQRGLGENRNAVQYLSVNASLMEQNYNPTGLPIVIDVAL